MAKEVFHNTLLTQSSLSDETVNLIDVCNSISLLTNCSTILYDFLNHNIEYVNISNAVNLKIKNMAQSKYECLNLLGDEGMDHLHRSCFHNNNFIFYSLSTFFSSSNLASSNIPSANAY